jgi:hypothetical protein
MDKTKAQEKAIKVKVSKFPDSDKNFGGAYKIVGHNKKTGKHMWYPGYSTDTKGIPDAVKRLKKDLQ